MTVSKLLSLKSSANFSLGDFEKATLLAIVHLKENAYGVTIGQEIKSRTGKEPSIAAIYTTLERLEKKGFISSREGPPTATRGGRSKRFYKVSGRGKKALIEAKETLDKMWIGVSLSREPAIEVTS